MEAQLAKLLAGNEPPSEEVFGIINERMGVPLEELAETNREIADLEAQLIKSKKRRGQIQASLKSYRMIVSPIRRLPDDVLEEIFYHCLPSHRNPTVSAAEAPVLLTRISSRWRSVVMSCPRLWARFYIGFWADNRDRFSIVDSPESDGSLERQRRRVLDLLTQRVDVLRDWLERSGACPLSVSLCYATSLWSPQNPFSCEMLDLASGLFETVLSHSKRLLSLELSMPLEFYRRLESMVAADLLSALVDLKMNFYNPVNPYAHGFDPMKYETISVFRAPHLRRVSLGGDVDTRLWSPHVRPFAELGTLLIYLSLDVRMPPLECLALLKECKNLMYCRLHISVFDEDTPLIQNLVSLQKLRSLAILDEGGDDVRAHEFYSSIDTPEVRWFDYHSLPFGRQSGQPTSRPVLRLLRNLINLKKLTLNPISFFQSELQEVLQAISPKLTHLVLGDEATLQSLRKDPYFNDPLPPLDVRFFTVDTDLDVLLPNLEVFEITSRLPIPDRVLLRIITSRLEVSTKGGCTALKSVRVIFDRVKQLDIRNELRCYCEQNMADFTEARRYADNIRLDLEYHTHLALVSDPLSALFGLENDRSWGQIDLEEPLME